MKDDQQPAFPTLIDHGVGGVQTFVGMTLRDYFAAAALTGFLANQSLTCEYKGYANDAYMVADEMLKAREE
jgi:hypothetical protein